MAISRIIGMASSTMARSILPVVKSCSSPLMAWRSTRRIRWKDVSLVVVVVMIKAWTKKLQGHFLPAEFG